MTECSEGETMTELDAPTADLYLDIGQPPCRPFGNAAGRRATRAERIRMGAARLGISVEAYEMHVDAGQRWCSRHRRWCRAEDFCKVMKACKAGAGEP